MSWSLPGTPEVTGHWFRGLGLIHLRTVQDICSIYLHCTTQDRFRLQHHLELHSTSYSISLNCITLQCTTYFSGSPMRGSLTLVEWKSVGACRATSKAATWEQAELVLDPLRHVQLWLTTRDNLGPMLR